MASDIKIYIDGDDVTSYVNNLAKIPLYGRNYDFSQIFDSITFTISYFYLKHGLISQGNSIVEMFLNDNCVYTGYVESVTIAGFYKKNIKVQHITQKLKSIKVMENQKDRTLIYQTRPEFEFIGETVTVLEFIEGIFKTIGYTALESNDNYIDENGDSANILSLNKFLNNIRYWDMEVVFLKNQNKITFPIEPNDAPSMWDMLHYFQKIFKFSCKFGSLSDASPTVKVISPGHYYAKDFTLPLSHGINSEYQSLKESISITDSKLLSDIPVKKGIVKDSMAINQSYIDILLYTDPTTPSITLNRSKI